MDNIFNFFMNLFSNFIRTVIVTIMVLGIIIIPLLLINSFEEAIIFASFIIVSIIYKDKNKKN